MHLSNARKLFRVLKFLKEYKTINGLLGKADTMAIHQLVLKLIPRVAFFFYWIFDTLIVLCKIKFFTNLDLKWITHKWGICWTIANFTGIIAHIVDLVDLGDKEAKLIAQKKVAASSGVIDSKTPGQSSASVDEIKAKLKQVHQDRFSAVLGLIAKCGDSITSTNIIGWDKQYLGYQFHNGQIGLGGLTSAVIGTYTLYPK